MFVSLAPLPLAEVSLSHAAARLALLGGLAATVLTGCGPKAMEDPLLVLQTAGDRDANYERAMVLLDEAPSQADGYEDALVQVMFGPGYGVRAREAALDRLAERDLPRTQDAVNLNLAKLPGGPWRERLCAIIGERGWKACTPALVRAWAVNAPGVDDDDRYERAALVELYGEAQVVDEVFRILAEGDSLTQQTLRIRSWELLQRMGYRERLAALVTNATPRSDDALLIDLQAAARDLGVLPWNKQEILWLRWLRQPAYASFWQEASTACQALTGASPLSLEMRHVPICVAAHRHAPELLTASREALYEEAKSLVRSSNRRLYSRSYDGLGGDWSQRIVDWKDELTWGDLAAVLLARQAMGVEPLVEHLFDYADRDQKDKTTEVGGVIALDAQGRFELDEFYPRERQSDVKFIAPFAMIERGYTGLFHMHYHAQKFDNDEYAGPGFGDAEYAHRQRVNCLVFTFVDRDTMNVDYYRHGNVIVDLGEIRRP